MSKLTFAAAPAALLFAAITGCADSDAAKSERPQEFDRPEGLRSALENPIADCQATARDCADNASDLDARIACNDTLGECLRDAAERAQNIAQQVEACREDGRVCLLDGNDADSCRDDYEACADAALNGGGVVADSGVETDDAGSAEPSLDGGTSTDPGLPGLPGLPSLPGLPGLGGVDGGLIDNLPEPVKCTIELRLCLSLDITAASECADTARLCLQIP